VGTEFKISEYDRKTKYHSGPAISRQEIKLAVISCRASDDLDARLKQAASILHLTKSQLIHDIAVRFVEQMDKQGIRLVTKLDRAQRTRELARELHDLWSDEPKEATAVMERRTA
jgi:hypothetical protein